MPIQVGSIVAMTVVKEMDYAVWCEAEGTRNLTSHASPELWECLIAHENDRRYWMTLADESGASHFGSAHNWLVGDYCSAIAYAQLTFPVKRHWAVLEEARPVNDRGMREPPVRLPLPFAANLLQWRKSHPKKTFAELQIEVCEQVLSGLPKLNDVAEQTRDEFRVQIESEIEHLKKSKRGIFGETRVFSGERYNRYDARRAADIRRGVLVQRPSTTNTKNRENPSDGGTDRHNDHSN